MKTYTFTVAEHEEYGGLGFKPSWYPNGDPLPGMAVAHDILEHFPGDDGSVEGELQALGASLYIRGESGYTARYSMHPVEKHIGADFPLLWEHMQHEDHRDMVKECPKVRESSLLEQCRECVRYGVNDIEGNEVDPLPSKECRERMACWLAVGFKRAEKRYKGKCYEVAWSLFQPIQQEAGKLLKHAEEGMVLTVQVDFQRHKTHVSCDYPEGDNY